MASLRASARKPYSRPPPRGPAADGPWLHDRAPAGSGKAQAAVKRAVVHATTPAAPGAVNNSLLVSNLHYEITPKDLSSIFGTIGTLMNEPLLKYDRSGRSTGEAVLVFEKPAEATRAKKQFHGILAKGQPMSISYHAPPRAPRSASAPQTVSLLNRIEKPPLLERISKDDTTKPNTTRQLSGPVRNKRGEGNTTAKAPKGPKPKGKPAPTKAAKAAPKKPKTAEELDNELDAFMGDADTAAPAAGDVDMV